MSRTIPTLRDPLFGKRRLCNCPYPPTRTRYLKSPSSESATRSVDQFRNRSSPTLSRVSSHMVNGRVSCRNMPLHEKPSKPKMRLAAYYYPHRCISLHSASFDVSFPQRFWDGVMKCIWRYAGLRQTPTPSFIALDFNASCITRRK